MAEMVHGARNDTKSQNCIYLMYLGPNMLQILKLFNFGIIYSFGFSKNLNSHLIWDRVCLSFSVFLSSQPLLHTRSMSSQGLSCAHLPPLCRSTGMTAMHYWYASSGKVGSGDSNSGLQACRMSAFPRWAISPWPFQSIFDFVFSN